MKAAILISGQPRNYQRGYEELRKTYLDKYNCDVFLHTWDAPKQTATQFFPNRPVNEYTFNDGWVDELLNLYKPIKYIIEPPKIFDADGVVDPMWRQPLQATRSMYYSIAQTFALTNPGYDCYIRCRFDIRYEESTSRLEELDLTKLHVWDWDTDERVKHRGYYDVFAVGTYDTLGIYSNVYDRLNWYLMHDNDYQEFLSGGWPGQDSKLRNEYLLRWHITTSGVPVTVHSNSIKHADGHILR